MLVDKRLIRFNFSSRNGAKPIYIVVHDTGNRNLGAGAISHFKYFNSGNKKASAHYFVDDKNIVETVETSLAAWHCGDGRGRFGITNQNSIGVEICINPDSDYNVALSNARVLIRGLMSMYNIPIERVVRHYDASRKICPRSMSANNWENWWKFKNSL